jgi:hypothetical protein
VTLTCSVLATGVRFGVGMMIEVIDSLVMLWMYWAPSKVVVFLLTTSLRYSFDSR